MLDFFYHVASRRRPAKRNLVIGEGSAVGGWDFVGRHIGEFAGVPATNGEVNVPLCVAYDLRDGKTSRAGSTSRRRRSWRRSAHSR